MIYKMNLQNSPFCMIKDGSKDIELRLYDEKRQKIKIGDMIEFSNNDSGEILMVSVVNLHLYSNFNELYKNFDKIRLGYKYDDIANPSDMSMYYSNEDIEKYGVVGIEIKKVDSSIDIGINNNYGTFKLRVAGIIVKNDKILLARAKKYNGYVFPGGHVEIGELTNEAIKREVNEELKIDFEVESLFCIHENMYALKDNKIANEICYYYKINVLDELPDDDFTIEELDKGVPKKHEYTWIEFNDISNQNINPKAVINLIKSNISSCNNILTTKENR